MIVKFIPDNVTQTARKGERILDIAGRAGVMIDGSCAGKGNCGKCRIQITGGKIPPADSIEQSRLTVAEIAGGYRLACRCKINSDVTVMVPQANSAAARKTKLNTIPENFRLTEHIKKRFIEVEPATLKNQHADEERLISALGNKKLKVNPRLLGSITKTLKENGYKITAVLRNDEIIDLEGGASAGGCYYRRTDQRFCRHKPPKQGNTTMSHLIMGVNPE